MTPHRSISLAAVAALAATALAAAPALAQSCLGLAMPGKSYVGAAVRRSWSGHERRTPVYGGQFAHRFDVGERTGLTAMIEGAGGTMRADSTAVHAGGALALSHRIDERIAVCASAGLEMRGVDVSGDDRSGDADGDGYVSVPLSFGIGYDVHVGGVTVTPFLAPTFARYQFESRDVAGGARQKGWDSYVAMGATASLDRFSVGATYRHGDRALGEAGRFAFTTGVTF